jgi:hypothetical protein
VAYVADAIDLAEEYYYKTDEVDWGPIRSDAMGLVEANPSQVGAYTAIREALRATGANHTFLRPYQEASLGTVVHTDPPYGGRIELDTGAAIGEVVLTPLPGVLSDQWTTYATQVQSLLRAADETDPVCGWVVDLRTTGGETIEPFLLAVAPLLGSGTFLSYVGPAAHGEFSYEDGLLYVNGAPFVGIETPAGSPSALVEATKEASVVTDPYVVHDSDAPVAVLISYGTASASEGVLVAFLGRPGTRTFGSTSSYGVPTGNAPVLLADGSTIVITGGEAQDRLGSLYDGPIVPDQLVAVLPTDSGDRVLDAALAWLEAQPSCR